VVVKSVCGAT